MKIFAQNAARNRLAFTLVDVMVGVGVLGVVMLSLFACFTLGFNFVKISRDELKATQLLQERMETIRLYKWSDLTNSGVIATSFSARQQSNGPIFFTGTVAVSAPTLNGAPDYAADLREVTVSVTWTNNHSKITNSTRTFVSQYGLQNYVLKP